MLAPSGCAGFDPPCNVPPNDGRGSHQDRQVRVAQPSCAETDAGVARRPGISAHGQAFQGFRTRGGPDRMRNQDLDQIAVE